MNINGQAAPINTGACTQSNFFWSNPPTKSGDIATGIINGIGYTYSSNVSFQTTSYIHAHYKFPSEYNIPDQTSIRNDYASQNKLTFDQPMTNPVLVFASIGGGAPNPTVSIQFENNFSVVWAETATTTVDLNAKKVTGTEGNIIIRFEGTFTELNFNYLNAESWVNFAFGADFSTTYEDTVAPTLTLNGSPTQSVNLNTTYTDLGANATDNCDTNPAVLVSGAVDTTIPGTYILTYTAVDASGNTSKPLTRIVTVKSSLSLSISKTDNSACNTINGNATAIPSGGSATFTYLWSNGETTQTVTGLAEGNYSVTVEDAYGQKITKNITINTPPGPDNDGDGVDDACDLDDDNDGILDTDECTVSDFKWSSTQRSGFNANSTSGQINGDIIYTYTSSHAVTDNDNIYNHSLFPTEYNIPNQAAIRNTEASSNTLTFSKPITNPVLVFASIGQSGVPVPISFSDPVEVLWSKDVVKNSSTKITGTEGYAVIRLNGTFSEIKFDYLAAENWVNFTFGADFFTYCDTDGDGIVDALDTDSDNDGCPDVIEAGYTDSNSNGVLGGATVAVDANGLVLNHGGYTGTTNLVTDTTLNGCNEPPVAKAKNITVYVDANCRASIENNAIDDGSSDPDEDEITYSLSNNGPFEVGSYEITMTVTDPSGETDTAIATVTAVDNTKPVVTPPADITVDNDYGICGAVVNFEATATDNCDVTITYDIQPGSVFGVGTTVVTATATDASENTAVSTFSITVIDKQAPNITSPFDITTNTDLGVCGAVVNYDVPTASDNCGTGTPPTELANHTYKGTLNGHTYFLSNTKVTAEVAHANAIAAGGHLVTITDATENLFVSQFISDKIWIGATDRDVEGTWKWISNEQMNYTNWATGEPNNYGAGEDWAVINWSGNNPDWNDWFFYATAYYAIEFDGGTLPTTLVSGPAPGEVFPVGTTTVTYEAVDPSGNRAETSFDVIVKDNEAPTVVTQNIIVELDAEGNTTINVADINNGSSDNCAIESMALDITSFTCANIGDNTVTLTVTDNSTNSSSATATVTVVDNTPPTVNTQPVTVILNRDGNASITTDQIDNGSFDNCSVESMSLDVSSFTCANLGENTVTLIVTDVNGNVSTGTAMVTVEDNTAPTVKTKDFSIALSNGSATITAADINDGSFDNCDFTLSIDKETFTCSDIGDHTVILTATDASGNTSSEVATVTIEGEVPEVTIADFTAVGSQKVNTIFLGYGPQSINLSATATGGDSFTYDWSSSTGEYLDNVANPEISPIVSTTYTVVVTNSFGCTTSASFEVCVIDARSYNKKAKLDGKVTICHHTSGKKGTKHVMISISKNAVSKHLSNHGDTLGACNATCVTADTPFSSKSKEADNVLIFTEALVYPNPSRGVFEIKIANVKAGTEINLVDINGRLVSRKIITSDALSQNLTIGNRNLPTGVYILRIISTEETITKKLIVNRE